MKKLAFALSIAINVLIALPALVLVTMSSSTQFFLYERILAPAFGQTEVAFIGDSLTAGGELWGIKLGRIGFDTRNFGQGSFMTRQMGKGVAQAISAKASVAFVMSGRNDDDKTQTGVEKSFAEYRTVILEPLMAANIKPVIQLTLYSSSDKDHEFVDGLNERLLAFASEKKLPVIDLNKLLCRDKLLLPEYTTDGVHLSKGAYIIWSKEVLRVLDELSI